MRCIYINLILNLFQYVIHNADNFQPLYKVKRQVHAAPV